MKADETDLATMQSPGSEAAPDMRIPANAFAFAEIARYHLARRAGRDAERLYRDALAAIEKAPADARRWWRLTLDEALNAGRGGRA